MQFSLQNQWGIVPDAGLCASVYDYLIGGAANGMIALCDSMT